MSIEIMACGHTPPRHGDVDDRAEEKEHNDLGKTASHGIILRHIFPSPAAFGAAVIPIATQIIPALHAPPAPPADRSSSCTDAEEQIKPDDCVKECVDKEAAMERSNQKRKQPGLARPGCWIRSHSSGRRYPR